MTTPIDFANLEVMCAEAERMDAAGYWPAQSVVARAPQIRALLSALKEAQERAEAALRQERDANYAANCQYRRKTEAELASLRAERDAAREDKVYWRDIAADMEDARDDARAERDALTVERDEATAAWQDDNKALGEVRTENDVLRARCDALAAALKGAGEALETTRTKAIVAGAAYVRMTGDRGERANEVLDAIDAALAKIKAALGE